MPFPEGFESYSVGSSPYGLGEVVVNERAHSGTKSVRASVPEDGAVLVMEPLSLAVTVSGWVWLVPSHLSPPGIRHGTPDLFLISENAAAGVTFVDNNLSSDYHNKIIISFAAVFSDVDPDKPTHPVTEPGWYKFKTTFDGVQSTGQVYDDSNNLVLEETGLATVMPGIGTTLFGFPVPDGQSYVVLDMSGDCWWDDIEVEGAGRLKVLTDDGWKYFTPRTGENDGIGVGKVLASVDPRIWVPYPD